jgi:hypothetical protein
MTKEERLLKRPRDENTRILAEHIVDFGAFKGLMELWQWGGICATSIILLNEDVRGQDREALIASLFHALGTPVDPQVTFQHSDDYLYVNFAFKVKD